MRSFVIYEREFCTVAESATNVVLVLPQRHTAASARSLDRLALGSGATAMQQREIFSDSCGQ